MVVRGDSPMKRRKTDGPVTASQIAESNKTLHILSGRHNRWMSGADANGEWQTAPAVTTHTTAGTNSSAVDPTATLPSLEQEIRFEASTDTTAPSSNGMPSERQHGQERPPSTAAGATTNAPSSSGPPLVQYGTPPTAIDALPHIGIPTPAANGRKSVDAMAITNGQPSLPSPASSDGSPTFAAQALRRGRPSLTTTAASIRPSTNSPALPHQPSPLQHPMRQQAPTPTHPHPTWSPPVQQQVNHGQGPLVQQQTIQQTAQPNHRHSMSGQAQHAAPQGRSPSLQTPPTLPSNAPVQQLPASRIPPQQLLQQLHNKEAQMRQTNSLSATDYGRISLLRDAVEKGDWFYQVLSQLFCLRTVSPRLLPKSLRDVDHACWAYLDILICPNNDLNQDLVEFFADFPEDLMNIYSDQSNARAVYELRVQSVKTCLNKLPTHWDNFVAACKRMPAPPLVQDLHDILYLKSPVLQSTAFRAISRMIFGNGDLDYKGVQAMEKLHFIDQDTFLRRPDIYRRNKAQREQAYSVLLDVYRLWAAHLKRHASSPNFPDFPPPLPAVNFFRQPPQNVMPVPPQPVQQQQQQPPPVHGHRLSTQQAQIAAQRQRINSGQLPEQPMPSPSQQQIAQMPAQLAQLATLGAQLQAGRPATIPGPAIQRQPSKHIFPRAEEQPRPQPTNPDWTRSGLHQSHLRSPDLGPVEHENGAPLLYRHVFGFAVPPTKLKKSLPSQTITFSISQKAMDKIPKTDKLGRKGEALSRRLSEESLLYRLRCSVLPKGGFVSASAWVTADNSWPDEMYFELNGTILETRRKLHHGRHLPIDLTQFLRAGENTLRVSRKRMKGDPRSPECAIAVEVVRLKSHDAIKEHIPRISASDSLSAIKKSLAGVDGGDDELAVTSSALTIKLFDPYSGCKIFDVPVRGSNCLHRDCFDLETFLQMCKRPHPGWPTVTDCWRCPLCRGDVRPQMLVVDEFLVDVRKDLEKRGLLDTRAITVNADGSWKPKLEETTGVRSASLEREERGSMPRPVSTSVAPQQREVIEID